MQLQRILRPIPMLLLMTWTLVPLLWLFLSTFKEQYEVFDVPTSIITQNFSFRAYLGAVQSPGFFRYLGNSVILSVTSVVVAVAFGAIAAYGFTRYAFKWRHLLLLLVLLPRLLPRAGIIIPLYMLFANLRLLNTYTVLILSYAASAVPFATWILVGFFHGVPKELDEAAFIDGAGFWRSLVQVVLPVAMPGLVTAVVISFVMSWNEFPFVLAFTTTPKMRTLPYQLYMFRDTLGVIDWPLINAFSILTMLPILLTYIVFERHIVRGLTGGALR